MIRLIFLYLFFIPFLSSPNSDEIIGAYAIKSPDNFSFFEIKKDATFTYNDRGISAWGWHTFEGRWSYSKDTLVLEERLRPFDPEKYIIGNDDEQEDETLPRFRYHKYQLIKNQLLALPNNELDANRRFYKFDKKD